MARLVLFNKPYGVLSQFTDEGQGRPTLKDWIEIPVIRPAGRLDFDSEGLLLLTDSGPLQAYISNPRHKLWKTYWVQVEGIPDQGALETLQNGLILKDGPTLPAKARMITPPEGLWTRDPPIRYRASIPTRWIELCIREGRNRQVRRMTAAVGHPTLRLIRITIGEWAVQDLLPGEWREVPFPREGAISRPSKPTRFSSPKKGKKTKSTSG